MPRADGAVCDPRSRSRQLNVRQLRQQLWWRAVPEGGEFTRSESVFPAPVLDAPTRHSPCTHQHPPSTRSLHPPRMKAIFTAVTRPRNNTALANCAFLPLRPSRRRRLVCVHFFTMFVQSGKTRPESGPRGLGPCRQAWPARLRPYGHTHTHPVKCSISAEVVPG